MKPNYAMNTKPLLTTELLEAEYNGWGDSNRNKQDLRFGQYLASNYTGFTSSDVFHWEDKEDVLKELREELARYQR